MKRKMIILLIILILGLAGCKNTKVESLTENIKKIELTGNLVTYKAFYHNVIEYEKTAGSGISHIFEKDRVLFAEYTGTIKLGIDLSKVKISVDGNQINVFVPKAIIIGEPDVDKEDFKEENFIESKDSFWNKNPLTANDSAKAFEEAQENMKMEAINNSELLSIAQKRAQVIIEENIRQLSGMSEKSYNVNWEFEV